MEMIELLRRKHEIWLTFLFGSFALPRGSKSEELFDFALIHFRHLKWIAQEIVASGEDVDWNRNPIPLNFKDGTQLYEALSHLLQSIRPHYPVSPLFQRIVGDEEYMLTRLHNPPQVPISAFERHLHFKGLDRKSLDNLILFLVEESYKEYELILTYTYSQLHSDDATIALIFEDLVQESLYHLKSFALLMAKLGILSVPRVVMEQVYKFQDLKAFLLKGIEEERAAKEQCKALSQGIADKELATFFEYINQQEEYHIYLMEKVLQRL
ncbi:MAG: iron-binding protein [Nitratiruptor sp.]|nr:iron-binding protein [Nitratiruptor sp.]NPA83626.1 iron-binding protein [Campylobacterota bacterium]